VDAFPSAPHAATSPLRAQPAQAGKNPPGLREVLAQFSPLPEEALFLGVAEDGLPLLLNLADPLPGPLLIAGDVRSGKTAFLRGIAATVNQGRPASRIVFSVLSHEPDEWHDVGGWSCCMGIFGFGQMAAVEYASALVEWAHTKRGERQYVLLLVDGLKALTEEREIQPSLRWLLLRGPARHIWPIVTLATTDTLASSHWLDFFRTRLFGHMEGSAPPLTGSGQPLFRHLRPNRQFALREGSQWLTFWIPPPDESTCSKNRH